MNLPAAATYCVNFQIVTQLPFVFQNQRQMPYNYKKNNSEAVYFNYILAKELTFNKGNYQTLDLLLTSLHEFVCNVC